MHKTCQLMVACPPFENSSHHVRNSLVWYATGRQLISPVRNSYVETNVSLIPRTCCVPGAYLSRFTYLTYELQTSDAYFIELHISRIRCVPYLWGSYFTHQMSPSMHRPPWIVGDSFTHVSDISRRYVARIGKRETIIVPWFERYQNCNNNKWSMECSRIVQGVMDAFIYG